MKGNVHQYLESNFKSTIPGVSAAQKYRDSESEEQHSTNDGSSEDNEENIYQIIKQSKEEFSDD